jgi:hypothetical protein
MERQYDLASFQLEHEAVSDKKIEPRLIDHDGFVPDHDWHLARKENPSVLQLQA